MAEMHWGENLRLAVWALSVDKVKAFLTMLGVMIGSASIVLVVTIASSGRAYVVSQVEGIGANLTYATLDRNGAAVIPDDELSPADLQAVKEGLTTVKAAAGTYDILADFILGGKTAHGRLVGVTEDFQEIRHLLVVSGRYFDSDDYLSRAKVCMVTPQIVEKAFTNQDPIGQPLQLERLRCTVIGVFREGVPTFGQSEIQDETVLVPFPLIKTITGENFFQVIYAQAASPGEVPGLTEELSHVLQSRHRREARYSVQDLSSVLKTVKNISTALGLVLLGVAALTLVTAGAGIMNIMLVNIAQRTHEIGVRKALGARGAEIRMQFLMEAAFISFGGALVGAAIAVGLVWFVPQLIEGAVPIGISWGGVVTALLLSTGVGVLFGYRPASEAANLNPVQAIKID